MTEEMQEKRRLGKLLRTGVGRLFLALAGGGALVLVIFVLIPWLTEPPDPEPPKAPQEIVAEVLGEALETAEEQEDEQPGEGLEEPLPATQGAFENEEERSALPSPTPLVAVRDNGETMPVVFPRPQPEEDSTPAAEPDAGLPPPLSPEEIEAALPEPALEASEGSAPQALAQAAEAAGVLPQSQLEGLPAERPAVTLFERPVGAAPAEVREVQALLAELGYDPGPADGVWGRRTTAAWQAFAREVGGLALALAAAAPEALSGSLLSPGELEELEEPEADRAAEQTAEPAETYVESRAPLEAPLPSEEPPHMPVSGAGQAGNQPPGLPAHTVVASRTLRGVMGYRLPLVSRQEVPDQVVSGVLIPTHTTFVILRPGFWELTGLDAEDVQFMRDAEARAEAERLGAERELEPQPARRSWNPLRLFRRQPTVMEEK